MDLELLDSMILVSEEMGIDIHVKSDRAFFTIHFKQRTMNKLVPEEVYKDKKKEEYKVVAKNILEILYKEFLEERKIHSIENFKNNKENDKFIIDLSLEHGNYHCINCKSNNVSVTSQQKRSCDEAETTIYVCRNCGTHF